MSSHDGGRPAAAAPRPDAVRILRRDQIRRQLGLPMAKVMHGVADLVAANEQIERFPWMVGLKVEPLHEASRTLIPVRDNPYLDRPNGRAFVGTRINGLLYREPRQGSLKVYEFRNVCIASSGNNCAIFRGTTIDPQCFGIVEDLPALAFDAIETIEVGAICDDWYRAENPCHFVVDRLPRAHFYMTLLGLPEKASTFVWRNSPFAAYAKKKVFPGSTHLKANKAYRFETLYVLSSVFEPKGHPFWYLDQGVMDAILPKLLAGLPTPAATRKLYLSRSDTRKRPLLNEAELEARLGALGFESITMGALTPEEQLATARSAAVIVAPHGAALINILAAHPGTRVVELLNPDRGTAAYAAISDALNLDYRPVFGTGVTGPEVPNEAWTIEVDAVETALAG